MEITNLKKWLHQKYVVDRLNMKEISLLMYDTRSNSPNVGTWIDKLGIPKRSQSEAVAMQWEDNNCRRERQAKFMKEKMAAGTEGREKLIRHMQTEEYRQVASLSKIGDKNPMYGITGDKHPQWNASLTDLERLKSRNYKEYVDWRTSVFERDDFTCQACAYDKGGYLNAHHLNSYHWDKKSRLDINNGVTLCVPCHKEFHDIYGYKENDFFQFTQFQVSKSIVSKTLF